jgi:hypothetical protein
MQMSKVFTLRSGALIATLLLTLTAGATTQDSSPSHHELAAWVGHWNVRIDTKETQFGHARTDYYDGKCSFLPHGTFVACEYLSLQPDPALGRVRNDVAVLYYSDVDKTFKYTNVAPEGGPEEDIMHVDGSVWTRPFEIQRRSGGIIDAREIYTFVSPNEQLGQLEISTDKGAHWTVVNHAVGTRVKSP